MFPPHAQSTFEQLVIWKLNTEISPAFKQLQISLWKEKQKINNPHQTPPTDNTLVDSHKTNPTTIITP